MAEGQRQSRRPDGTLRPAVRVREGYIPPEEQSKYSDKWKSEDDGAGGIPGAGTDPATEAKPMSKTAAKNKRRIERDRTLKPEKDGAGKTEGGDSLASADAPLGGSDAGSLSSSTVGSRPPAAAGAAPAASEGVNEVGEVEKKIKTLRKRLRQIEELEEKLMSGALLNADQTAKVASKERIEGVPRPRARRAEALSVKEATRAALRHSKSELCSAPACPSPATATALPAITTAPTQPSWHSHPRPRLSSDEPRPEVLEGFRPQMSREKHAQSPHASSAPPRPLRRFAPRAATDPPQPRLPSGRRSAKWTWARGSRT